MNYSLEEINFKTVSDPKGFLEECDALYQQRIDTAAEKIIGNIHRSPIVLLCGPSGSGKTTSSMKLAEALEKRGIGCHYVGMDDYFKTVDPKTVPRTPEGDMDLESPLCLDMELMNVHFTKLAAGERIYVPKYEFTRQMRVLEPGKTLQLKKDEVVIFEGIHAFNSMITDVHPEAFKLYISASSNVEFKGVTIYKSTWFRLVRRLVRDYNFRGSDPKETMAMWANVRRGERANISPFKSKADYRFDTAFAYEPAVFNEVATKLFQSVPEGIDQYEELRQVLPALQLFGVIDNDLVAPDAMVREFIGGGVYNY